MGDGDGVLAGFDVLEGEGTGGVGGGGAREALVDGAEGDGGAGDGGSGGVGCDAADAAEGGLGVGCDSGECNQESEEKGRAAYYVLHGGGTSLAFVDGKRTDSVHYSGVGS